MNKWNALVWPLVVLTNPNKRTLQVGLAIFQGEQLTGAQWNELMAASMISLYQQYLYFCWHKVLHYWYRSTGIKNKKWLVISYIAYHPRSKAN